MKLITLYLPEPYIKMLEQLVTERFYPNRAEAIRVAIRDLINDEVVRRKWVDQNEPHRARTQVYMA